MSTTDIVPSPTAEPRERTACIHASVDADLVLLGHPHPRSGEGAEAPRSLLPAQGCMIVVGGAESQGTRDITLEARAGDAVRVFAKSGSNNFEHAVLLQGIHHTGGDEVLGTFRLVAQERTGIAPASAKSALPAQLVRQHFSFCECDVVGEGAGSYSLVLTLYDRDEAGQPRFVGHYQWNARITVHLVSSF